MRSLQVDDLLGHIHNLRGLTAVLGCHRVSPHQNPFWPAMHPRVFEELLRFLHQKCAVVSLDDNTPTKLPRVVLTFDDGYYDFIEYTMPALARYSIRANQNIIPACVESGVPPWTVRVSDFLLAAPPTLIREIRVDGLDVQLMGADSDSKARFGVALSRALKTKPMVSRSADLERLEALMTRLGPFRTTRMMARADVLEVSAHHEIGVHSNSHESMGVESTQFFMEDLERCFTYFRELLGLPMRIYAFPNGSHRPEQVTLLQQRGIAHVLLVEEKLAHGRSRVWPRITMAPCSGSHARLQAMGLMARGTQ